MSRTSTDGLQIRFLPIGKLCEHPTNARTHSPKQIRQIADSMRRFGNNNPILIDEDGNILAGHGRYAAAKLLGLKTVPTICLAHLSPVERRAYMIADNRLHDLSKFDLKLLAAEVTLILEEDPSFEVEAIGFDAEEIELLIDLDAAPSTIERPAPPPERDRPALCRLGDLWLLGQHKLLCGDALQRDSFVALMERERARMVFVDPPYNVAASAISGKGKIAHGAFAMASGEMSEAEFTHFLTTAFALLKQFSVAGTIHHVCMDWRHQFELLTAARAVYDRQLDLCVWAKSQPGMGTPYRQQHELIAVFKHGRRAHVDNIELGRNGRNRSNVWSYSAGPSFSAQRQQELAWHPTCKPVALVRDAILDASHRNDLVIDSFAGSGTTLIAAEEAGRRARLVEIDPHYCDVIVRRFEAATGLIARTVEGATLADRLADGTATAIGTKGGHSDA